MLGCLLRNKKIKTENLWGGDMLVAYIPFSVIIIPKVRFSTIEMYSIWRVEI